MHINLLKSRKEYFANLSVSEILHHFVNKSQVSVNDVRQLYSEGKVVVGTKEGNLEKLLGLESESDSLALVSKINELSEDQLLVLPPNYRIDSNDARQVVSYSLDTIVNLDSAIVKRKLMGDIIPRGRLSARRKQKEQWSPEKVVGAAFNHLYENREELAEKVFSCYGWWGKDGHRRVVSLYRAIQGAELRAFQNFAAFKLKTRQFRKELRLGKSSESKYQDDLTPEEIIDKNDKVNRYERYLRRKRREGKPVGEYVKKLDVDFTDLIELTGSFDKGLGQHIRVPSRFRKNRTEYKLKLTDVPLLYKDDPLAYSLVWEIAGNCHCEDKSYRSDRHRQKIGQGSREDFYCSHEISAFHTLRKKHENKKKIMSFLPFVMPTASMMNYLERLRHQTIMLTYNSETERWSKRSLNNTEMENLLWKKVMAEGYESNFTTEIDKFKKMKYDPHLDLLNFKR